MKKAANILFLVGAILSIVCAVGYLVSAILCLVFAGNEAMIAEIINKVVESGGQLPPGFTAEELAQFICAYSIGCAVGLFLLTACAAVNAVFSFKARNTDNKAMFILAIVFGVLSCTEVSAVGGVFALIKGDTKVE